MKKRTELDWKELGRFVSMIVDLFATIRDTFKENGVGIEIIPWLLNEGKERFVAVLSNLGEEFKKFVAESVAKAEENTFFTPLSDEEAVKALVEADKYDEAKATTIVAAWRNLADELGYTGPIVWRVKAGFTLKEHAPKAGPCHEKFAYLQGWKLKNDEPTKNALVLFIPRLVEGSKSKTVAKQTEILSSLRAKLSLPEHHLVSFGSAAMLAGLILANSKRSGERAPLNGEVVRTDTFYSDGVRLLFGYFDESGLLCGYWSWHDGYRDSNLGCFALGVEVLGK